MVDRTPSGTRDVLPDEMRELRALTERVRTVFERAGYGEIYTPALEYERTFERDGSQVGSPYRLFDEHGNVLVLRSDMTVPIARLVGSRYPTAPTPLRFCYFAHAYRGVRPQRGQSREFMQAGVELIGAPGAEGTAEALTVLCGALDAAGLRNYRVGVGDVTLYPTLLESLGIDADERELILDELATGDFVGVERELARLPLSDADAELLLKVPRIRGGGEVLADLDGPLQQAGTGMHALLGLLEPQVAARVIFDFGLVRSLGYYTGAVFQVYDPAYGMPLGSGGRYDELLGGFGRPLPAVGFALDVERLHIALRAEERRGV
ncbi:MAG TPA: ATP phosphoribosyltransferase regulatory subunit [Solirubrobacteraceae bacterium]|jgi:ATP phosphoribosyltransferase regulatory subunit|nr:ATP phosphoribosyltransferase regulatory subunit [Solirubrobacteraceae bacterium]